MEFKNNFKYYIGLFFGLYFIGHFFLINEENLNFILFSLGLSLSLSTLYFFLNFDCNNNCKDSKDFEQLIEYIENEQNSKILFIVDSFWEDKNKLPDVLRKRIICVDSCEDDNIYKWLYRDNFYIFSDDENNYSDYSYSEDNNSSEEEYKKLQLILHTNGGNSATSDMLSNILLNYPGEVECYIPYYCFSAGSFIALSCNKIFMEKFAVIGPTDPQISFQIDKKNCEIFTAKAFLDIYNEKDINKISDYILLKVYNAKISQEDNLKSLEYLLREKEYDEQTIINIKKTFGGGEEPHYKPYNMKQLKELGLKVEDKFPNEFYTLFKSYLRMTKSYDK